MAHVSRRPELIRYGAATAFLAAATIAALLVRSGINSTDRSSSSSTPPAAHVATTTFVPPGQRRYYRVRPGDTLAGIAIRFNTTVSELKRMNPRVKATALYVHKRLRVK
jgi:LysM repeat protein